MYNTCKKGKTFQIVVKKGRKRRLDWTNKNVQLAELKFLMRV